MRHEVLSFDGMNLFGGAALVLAVVLLYARRSPVCIAAGALQSWAVALATAWQGWVRGDPQPYAVALIVLVVQGLLIPFVLGRASWQVGRNPAEPRPSAFPLLLAGLAAVVLAVFAVRSIAGIAAVPTREHLAVALSVVLLGLVTMAARRDVLLQAISFSSLLNGVILSAADLPGTPMAAWLAPAAALLVAAAILGATLLTSRAGRLSP